MFFSYPFSIFFDFIFSSPRFQSLVVLFHLVAVTHLDLCDTGFKKGSSSHPTVLNDPLKNSVEAVWWHFSDLWRFYFSCSLCIIQVTYDHQMWNHYLACSASLAVNGTRALLVGDGRRFESYWRLAYIVNNRELWDNNTTRGCLCVHLVAVISVA